MTERALTENQHRFAELLGLHVLTDALVVRQLQPWYANLARRQVKSPRIYIRDSGLLHLLLGIHSSKPLFEHPKVGASWEGFVIEQVLAAEAHDEAYFWAIHQGAEIDLILYRAGKLFSERRTGTAPGHTHRRSTAEPQPRVSCRRRSRSQGRVMLPRDLGARRIARSAGTSYGPYLRPLGT